MAIDNLKTSAGNDAANQVVITDDNGTEFFYSHKTLIGINIAFGRYTGIYLDKKWHEYTSTIIKYRNQWLGFQNSKQFNQAVESGECNIQIMPSASLHSILILLS